jgi:hypothetical protein
LDSEQIEDFGLKEPGKADRQEPISPKSAASAPAASVTF